MKLAQFHAPGNLTDFNDQLAKAWSAMISDTIDGEIATIKSRNHGLQPQFYNASKLDVAGTAAPISWPAFPNQVELDFGDDPQQMLVEAEKRSKQDEYLEWVTVKHNGKVTRVIFTCESPEYWEFIADNDPTLLVTLYSKIAGKPVPKQDLFKNGAYDRENAWNAGHAIHLMQHQNTLGAEINIAVSATVLRHSGAHDPITAAIELIRCSGYGEERRNSDPHIGDVINQKARAGCPITLQDPVGLYIEKLPSPAELGWRKPDGSLVGDYWKLERGDKDHIVRAVYEVPAGETSNGHPFVVGDIKIGGAPVTAGGQLVRSLRIKLTGVIGDENTFHNPTFSCPFQVEGPVAAAAPHGNSRRA